MQIDVVAYRAVRHHRIVFVRSDKLRELVVGFLVNNCAVGNPSHHALVGLHMDKAPGALHHFQPLAIVHLGHAVGDRGNPVAQKHLPRPYVDILMLLQAQMRAAGNG